MNPHALCRALLAIFCGLQGLGTVVVDFNRSHATNPAWPGHARFHIVWQISSVVALSIVELALLLIAGPFVQQRFYIVAGLAAVPVLGFFFAVAARRFYSGGLSDPNGIQPIRFAIFGKPMRIDLSVVVEVVSALFLIVIVALYAHATSAL